MFFLGMWREKDFIIRILVVFLLEVDCFTFISCIFVRLALIIE